MKKSFIFIIFGVLAVASLAVFLILRNSGKSQQQQPEQQEVVEEITPADSAIQANVSWSKVKDNTIVLSIEGLKAGYTKVRYEISYETQGIVQGVTSRPLDISGQETFTRDDIYLGTCSRNVCKPHTGVKKVSVVLEFTDVSGKKSQLTKDFDL